MAGKLKYYPAANVTAKAHAPISTVSDFATLQLPSLVGTNGLDRLIGMGQPFIYGLDGHDYIRGSAQNETILGGAGNDTIYGDDYRNTSFKNLSSDRLIGGSGDDEITGDAKDRLIDGGEGNDWFFLNSGNHNAAVDVVIDLQAEQMTSSVGVVEVRGIENFSGGSGNDTIYGDSGDNIFHGNDGHDTIDGRAGNDTLRGGTGNDTLIGGDGKDTLSGSWGNDSLKGGAGNDTLHGGDDADILDGGTDDDIMFGGTGDDVLVGGAGDDILIGGDGQRDTVDGGEGNDHLIAGWFAQLPILGVGGYYGADATWTGGNGIDEFLFGEGWGGGWGDVIITDFENGLEKLDMRSTGASNMNDLTISDVGGGVEVEYNGNTILLEGMSVSDISTDDFIFA